ncbi:hypothetical protein [Enterobacter phage 02_vB_Eclo_IJM]|nr:hypothetical protein [Enterobacter phage 02_vB_Eclo_IJM]
MKGEYKTDYIAKCKAEGIGIRLVTSGCSQAKRCSTITYKTLW